MAKKKKETEQDKTNGKPQGPRALTEVEIHGVEMYAQRIKTDKRPQFLMGRYHDGFAARKRTATHSDQEFPHHQLRMDAHAYLNEMITKGDAHERNLLKRGDNKNRGSTGFSLELLRIVSAIDRDELPRQFDVDDLLLFAEGVHAQRLMVIQRGREKREQAQTEAASRA